MTNILQTEGGQQLIALKKNSKSNWKMPKLLKAFKTLKAHVFKTKTRLKTNISTKVQPVYYHFKRGVCVPPHPGLAFKRGFQLFKSADLNTSIKEDTFHTHCEK